MGRSPGPAGYRAIAVLLPNGDDPVHLGIVDGTVTFRPRNGAMPLFPDSRRRYVVGGLIDAHTHLTFDLSGLGLPEGSRRLVDDNRRRHLAAGTLFLRDVGAISAVLLDRALPGPGSEDRLPSVQAAGPFLAPSHGFSRGFYRPTAAADLAAAALAQVRAGARWVKLVADWPGGDQLPRFGQPHRLNYPEDALARTTQVVHTAGGRVAAHAISRAAVATCVRAGVDSVEHGWEMDERLLEEMAARGTAWTPTLASGLAAVREAERRDDRPAAHWVRARLAGLHDLLPHGQRLGLPILAGTDLLPHGSVAREIEALCAFGLAPAKALAAASVVPARFLGLPGLTERASADLVFYRVDPRESPQALSTPELVMLGGRVVARGRT